MKLYVVIALSLLLVCATRAMPADVDSDLVIDDGVDASKKSMDGIGRVNSTIGDDALDAEDMTDEEDAISGKMTIDMVENSVANKTRVAKSTGSQEVTSTGEKVEDKNDDSSNEESMSDDEESDLDDLDDLDAISADDVMVETNNGDVIGFKQTVLDRTIYTFLGIPYASPPISDLRFKLPKLVKPWRKPYTADSWPPHCEQTLPAKIKLPSEPIHNQMSEDCLYLNIWTPSINDTALKPVLVWFHGGFFAFGSSSNKENDGKTLSAFGDVVVVSFNYRLSAYGFLKMHSLDAPGNMGLWDQHMALKWVHANIDQFGGDPDSITLFGQGAGAFSIGIHMATQVSQNYFKRAIMQSGSPVQLNILFEQYEDSTNNLIHALGCESENGTLSEENADETLTCIKSQPTSSLKKAIGKVFAKYPLSFLPSIGGRMMPINPTETFEDPLFYYDKQKELMIGVNRDEGSLFLHNAFPDRFGADSKPVLGGRNETDKILRKLITKKLPLPAPLKHQILKYFSNVNDTSFSDLNEYTTHLYRIFSDNLITCPVVHFAKHFSSMPNKSAYFYEFTQRSSVNKFPEWVGVNTYEEVKFVFGLPVANPDKYTAPEVELSKRMMNTWVHFAKTGESLAQLGKQWPKFELASFEYITLNADNGDINTGIDNNCNLFSFALNADY